MPEHPVTGPRRDEDRAHPDLREVVVAGHRGDPMPARRALRHPDGRTRSAALGALARTGALTAPDMVTALGDPDPAVRRRACELAARTGAEPREVEGPLGPLETGLRRTLDDPDPVVVEAACFALGERREAGAVRRLATVATGHDDPRCREAAVAALGAIGERAGLATVLSALGDKPAVRRRAAVALAAFEGEEVEAALRRCLEDRDWQVRHVAEELLDEPPR